MDSRTGELFTAAQTENGVYIWTVKNPLYFKITKHHKRPFMMKHGIITLQVQFNYNLRKALGIHKCFLTCKIWTRLHPQTLRFLRVFKYQCIKYLDSLGVISINNVIRAISHVLYNVLEGTIDVIENHDIKFNIY
ncbi:replication enhancer protein [Tomato yellow leaf curl China virus -[Y264]]|uniref:Replication enhancer n=1 Tax=Tomato yellow leaf curl China virus TaxID=185793 RepID=B1VK78_TYLCC|nr:replication enhancer protein [Tomato yellow leaf curl China virus -[Y264]]CAQ35102.1 AC3 protein [Tomato yellow leaf curl China virus]